MINLFECLKESGFHSSIATTFSLDAAFYETNVQYRLRASGCKNNSLLVDRGMFGQALSIFPTAFTRAGSSYFLLPVSSPGSFHPKIFLRYGKNKADLIIGSANMTAVGWGANQEIIGRATWHAKLDTPENDKALATILKAHQYLLNILNRSGDENWAYKQSLIERECSWLNTNNQTDDFDHTSILLGSPVLDESLFDQVVRQIDGIVERMIIVSPYWDDDLTALKMLSQSFGHPEIHVYLRTSLENQTRFSTFPVSKISDDLNISFFEMVDVESSRFLHAKLFIFELEQSEIAVYGSANCTSAAMGGKGWSGKNDEAVWIDRFEKKYVQEQLGLSPDVPIDTQSISEPVDDLENDDDALPILIYAGSLFWKKDRIIWNCPKSLNPNEACLLFGMNEGAVVTSQGDIFSFEVPLESISKPFICQIRLADGRLSQFIIVSFSEALQMAAPLSMNSRLEKRLRAILEGDMDFLLIANDIDQLFKKDNQPKPKTTKTTKSKNVIQTLSGVNFATSEEFRQAIILDTSNATSQYLHSDNPALNYIMRIVLNDIVDVRGSDFTDLEHESNLQDCSLGDFQEENDFGIDKELPVKASQTQSKSNDSNIKLQISSDEFEKSKRLLIGTVSSFYDELRTINSEQEDIDPDIITKSILIFSLLLHGVTKEYKIFGDDKKHTLLRFDISRDRETSFLIWAGKLTQLLWNILIGKLFAQMPNNFDYRDNELQIRTLLAISKWALVMLLVFSREGEVLKRFHSLMERQVPQIFRSMMLIEDAIPEAQNEMIEGFMEKSNLKECLRIKIRQELKRVSAIALGKC